MSEAADHRDDGAGLARRVSSGDADGRKAETKKRLAEALRANLKRRKASAGTAARAGAEGEFDDDPPGDVPSGDERG